jgi:competence protein ComEC
MRKVLLAWAAGLVAGGGWGLFGGSQETRLTFLAVGQGDCAVFQTEGTAMLIDTGPRTDSTDAGQRIVLPRLQRMGIGRIALIVLTHPDSDHVGGLRAVLARHREARVAVSAAFRQHEGLLSTLKEAGVPPSNVLWLGPETRARLGAFTIQLSCPRWREGMGDNDGSVFVRLSNGAASATLTGDASSDTETTEAPGHDWSAQVLKAGHHGSVTATSQSWLEAVRPKVVVISCGRNNRYGHPHPAVLDRLSKRGVQILRTDTQGDQTFEATPSGFTLAR